MRILLLLFINLFTQVATAQKIESIVGKAHADSGPTVGSVGDAGDAVEIIMTWLGSYAALECNNKMKPSLKRNLVNVVKKFKDTIPAGTSVEFLVLTEKFKCEVIGLAIKTQTVRIQNGQCNIKDLELTEPSITYDPLTTGFFSIIVKF